MMCQAFASPQYETCSCRLYGGAPEHDAEAGADASRGIVRAEPEQRLAVSAGSYQHISIYIYIYIYVYICIRIYIYIYIIHYIYIYIIGRELFWQILLLRCVAGSEDELS